jgi:hypothetical protein
MEIYWRKQNQRAIQYLKNLANETLKQKYPRNLNCKATTEKAKRKIEIKTGGIELALPYTDFKMLMICTKYLMIT